MAKKNDNGLWLDPSGNPIPHKFIPPRDKQKEKMLVKLTKEAKRANKTLKNCKALVEDEVENFLLYITQQEGVAPNSGGNYTFTGFSGDMQVEVKVKALQEMDERLGQAKALIDQCLERWAEGGKEELRLVVFDAFKVDKKQKVDMFRILSLRRLKIKDPQWNDAMRLIGESVKTTGSKVYYHIREKDASGKMKPILLDFAAIETGEAAQ